MNSRLSRAGLVVAGLVLAVPAALAQTQQKPGLWETTLQVEMGQSMPQLPPGLLEQLGASGIELPIARPMTHRMCLLPEQVALDTVPEFSEPESGCSTREVQRHGDEFVGRIACNGRLQGQGHLHMALTSAESYAGRTDFQGLADGALPVDMRTRFSGQWLGADCGEVAPLGR